VSDTEQLARFIAAHAPPLRTSSPVLHWDGMGSMTRATGPPTGAEPLHPATASALRRMPTALRKSLA
jgi:hypothetical protein